MFLFVSSLLLLESVLSFNLNSVSTRYSFSNEILMSGGRSKEEKVYTDRVLFKQIRAKLNNAAQIPGFFDVGDGKPVIFSFSLIL
jgi:hypothetical protein